MIYFICIIHLHIFHGNIWTYNWPAPNVSGFIARLVERRTGIARSRVQAPLKSWIFFFRLLYAIAKIAIITARIILHLISYPQFTYDLFHMHHSPSYLSREHMNLQLTCSQRQWLHSSVGRASHRYREVTGSSPVEVLNFFQASLRNCKNCDHNCEDHSSFDFISAVHIWFISYASFTKQNGKTPKWVLLDTSHNRRKVLCSLCFDHFMVSFLWSITVKTIQNCRQCPFYNNIEKRWAKSTKRN